MKTHRIHLGEVASEARRIGYAAANEKGARQVGALYFLGKFERYGE